MPFRRIIFWLHLIAGLVAGSVIAVMSFTGAALAFEKQIIAWSERDARIVSNPEAGAERQSLDAMLTAVREQQPGARPTAITVANDPQHAVLINFGRTNTVYVNPYTAQIQPSSGQQVRAFMQLMLEWHRYLGQPDHRRVIGKAINGACNLAFLVLAITGLYLWWPRNWTRAALGAVTRMNFRLRGKARDWNWHNAVGFWTAPVLIVLTATALPISYRWAGDLIYKVTGTMAPQSSGPPGSAPSVEVPTPPEGARRLAYEELLAAVQKEVPNWKEISIRLGGGGGRGGSDSGGGAGREGAASNSRPSAGAVQAIGVTVKETRAWPLFSNVQLSFDPFTGAVLKREGFSDYNLGRQVRSWTRFLHTGEALGLAGQAVAGLASLLALLLVWTGFALSWRRFFKRKTVGNAEPS